MTESFTKTLFNFAISLLSIFLIWIMGKDLASLFNYEFISFGIFYLFSLAVSAINIIYTSPLKISFYYKFQTNSIEKKDEDAIKIFKYAPIMKFISILILFGIFKLVLYFV